MLPEGLSPSVGNRLPCIERIFLLATSPLASAFLSETVVGKKASSLFVLAVDDIDLKRLRTQLNPLPRIGIKMRGQRIRISTDNTRSAIKETNDEPPSTCCQR